jgi:hypothetical protein
LTVNGKSEIRLTAKNAKKKNSPQRRREHREENKVERK